MQKIIVTGSSGSLGKVLIHQIQQRKIEAIGLSRKNISYTSSSIKELCLKTHPTIIIHAAGSASVQDSIINPENDYNNSVTLFKNILKGVNDSGLKPLIVFISSAAVYGNSSDIAINENALTLPISPYGKNKLKCEKYAYQFAVKQCIPVLIVRLFSVFGPTQKKLLIWEAYNQAKQKGRISVQGSGFEARDYIHIDDACNTILDLSLEIRKQKEIYTIVNIASGKSIFIKDIVKLIVEHWDADIPVTYHNLHRKGDPVNLTADIHKLSTQIANIFTNDLKQQLEQTLTAWDNEV